MTTSIWRMSGRINILSFAETVTEQANGYEDRNFVFKFHF